MAQGQSAAARRRWMAALDSCMHYVGHGEVEGAVESGSAATIALIRRELEQQVAEATAPGGADGGAMRVLDLALCVVASDALPEARHELPLAACLARVATSVPAARYGDLWHVLGELDVDGGLPSVAVAAAERGDGTTIAGVEAVRALRGRPFSFERLGAAGDSTVWKVLGCLAENGGAPLAVLQQWCDAVDPAEEGRALSLLRTAFEAMVLADTAHPDTPSALQPDAMGALRRLTATSDISVAAVEHYVGALVRRGHPGEALDAAVTAAGYGYAVTEGLIALVGQVDSSDLGRLERALDDLGAYGERLRTRQLIRERELEGDLDAVAQLLENGVRERLLEGASLAHLAVKRGNEAASESIERLMEDGLASEDLLREYVQELAGAKRFDDAMIVMEHLVRSGFDDGTLLEGWAVRPDGIGAKARELQHKLFDQGFCVSSLTGAEAAGLLSSDGPRAARRVVLPIDDQKGPRPEPPAGIAMSVGASSALHWLAASFIEEGGEALEHRFAHLLGVAQPSHVLRGYSHLASMEHARLGAFLQGHGGAASDLRNSTPQLRAADHAVLQAIFSDASVTEAFARHLQSRQGSDAARARALVEDEAAQLLFVGWPQLPTAPRSEQPTTTGRPTARGARSTRRSRPTHRPGFGR